MHELGMVEERSGIKPSKGNRSARLRVEERSGIKPSKGNRSARLRDFVVNLTLDNGELGSNTPHCPFMRFRFKSSL
ncbi:hypothetical protein HanXRQr2_Chr17g0790581 [Helianthus annuus]|uniref:Uncharacterized protein n=1 Tax=Helianthus annuus TaxID=4232 RepID=A0A251RMB9_HELAN|nr:hypothetical protein HanXRQr2_Chr17g0790581 [Helianthus annuus]